MYPLPRHRIHLMAMRKPTFAAIFRRATSRRSEEFGEQSRDDGLHGRGAGCDEGEADLDCGEAEVDGIVEVDGHMPVVSIEEDDANYAHDDGSGVAKIISLWRASSSRARPERLTQTQMIESQSA